MGNLADPVLNQDLHSVVQYVLKQQNRNGVALIYDDSHRKTEITYSQLCRSIEETSVELGKYCQPREYIGVDATVSLEAITVLLSIVNIRALFCPLDLVNAFNQAITMCNTLNIATLIIHNRALNSAAGLQDWLSTNCKQVYSLSNTNSSVSVIKLNHSAKPLEAACKEVEFVVQSSGSTGSAKIIKVPGKCIYSNIKDLWYTFVWNSVFPTAVYQRYLRFLELAFDNYFYHKSQCIFCRQFHSV